MRNKSPVGTTQGPSETSPSDPRCFGPHYQHRPLRVNLFPPLRYSHLLAPSSTLSSLRPSLARWCVRGTLVSIQIPPFTTLLVSLCILLPRPAAPLSDLAFDQEIYLWLPSPRHHLARGFCGLCHRGPWILQPLSRHHQHASDARLELPHPPLPRLRLGAWARIRLARVMREHPFQRRSGRCWHGSRHHHCSRWGAGIP